MKTFGAQIRFLPGAWAPQMTMSVALCIQVDDNIIEIHQLLNAPNYDIEIIVNGVATPVTNGTVSAAQISISRFKTKQLIGLSGGVNIDSPWFRIRWTPFSVSIALKGTITRENMGGRPGCLLDTEGLVGSWVTSPYLFYRDHKPVTEDLSVPGNLRTFANSWRVPVNETIISKWLPIYSSNNSLSQGDVKEVDPTDKGYIDAKKNCSDVVHRDLGDLLKLLDVGCKNKELQALKDATLPMIDGCAYDAWVSNKDVFYELLSSTLNGMRLAAPIYCSTPPFIYAGESEFTLQVNEPLKLQLFDPTSSESIKWQVWSSSSNGNTVALDSSGTFSFVSTVNDVVKITVALAWDAKFITIDSTTGVLVSCPGVSSFNAVITVVGGAPYSPAFPGWAIALIVILALLAIAAFMFYNRRRLIAPRKTSYNLMNEEAAS